MDLQILLAKLKNNINLKAKTTRSNSQSFKINNNNDSLFEEKNNISNLLNNSSFRDENILKDDFKVFKNGLIEEPKINEDQNKYSKIKLNEQLKKEGLKSLEIEKKRKEEEQEKLRKKLEQERLQLEKEFNEKLQIEQEKLSKAKIDMLELFEKQKINIEREIKEIEEKNEREKKRILEETKRKEEERMKEFQLEIEKIKANNDKILNDKQYLIKKDVNEDKKKEIEIIELDIVKTDEKEEKINEIKGEENINLKIENEKELKSKKDELLVKEVIQKDDDSDIMNALDKKVKENKKDKQKVTEKVNHISSKHENDCDEIVSKEDLTEKDNKKKNETTKKSGVSIRNDYINNETTFKIINTNISETYFHSYFTDFEDKFKEKTYIFQRRRNSILDNCYFENHLIGEINLIDKMNSITRKYYDIQKEQYKKALEDLGDFKYFFEVYNKLNPKKHFIKNKTLDNEANPYKSRISSLIEFSKFYSGKIKSETKNFPDEIEYFRFSVSDGSSFYRLIVFGILEYYILNNQQESIKILLVDIYKILEGKKAQEKELTDQSLGLFFSIMSFILIEMENDSISNAYNILLGAFNSNEDFFDFIFDYYIRSILYLIAEDFYKEVFSNPNCKYKKASKKVLNDDEIEDVNLNLILNKKNEAFKLCFQLIPMIFNINISIYSFDGCISEKSNTVKYKIHEFNNVNEKGNDKRINLIYNMSHFCIAYIKNSNQLSIISQYNSLFVVDNPVLNIEEDKICSRCKNKTQFINIPYYKISICHHCFQSLVNFVFCNRVCYMNKENYLSREYYTKHIEIFKDVYINDYLYFLIMKENKSTTIRNLITTLCFYCDKNMDNNNQILTLNCKCQYCKDCMTKCLVEGTNNWIILNQFDKILLQHNKVPIMRCCCNEILPSEEAASKLSMNINDYKAESLKRLNSYVTSFCFVCLQHNEKNVEEGKFQSLNIENSEKDNKNSLDISYERHILCQSCIETFKSTDKKSDKEDKKINCSICKVDHTIKRKEWNQVVLSSSCCMII